MPFRAKCRKSSLATILPNTDSEKEKLSNFFYREKKETDVLRKQLREQSLSVFIQRNQE
jgi:hypothetical protein